MSKFFGALTFIVAGLIIIGQIDRSSPPSCDNLAREYWDNDKLVDKYSDKLSQNALDVRNGRRADYNAIAFDDQLSEALIKDYDKAKVEAAKKYVAKKECTKEAEFMQQVVSRWTPNG